MEITYEIDEELLKQKLCELTDSKDIEILCISKNKHYKGLVDVYFKFFNSIVMDDGDLSLMIEIREFIK